MIGFSHILINNNNNNQAIEGYYKYLCLGNAVERLGQDTVLEQLVQLKRNYLTLFDQLTLNVGRAQVSELISHRDFPGVIRCLESILAIEMYLQGREIYEIERVRLDLNQIRSGSSTDMSLAQFAWYLSKSAGYYSRVRYDFSQVDIQEFEDNFTNLGMHCVIFNKNTGRLYKGRNSKSNFEGHTILREEAEKEYGETLAQIFVSGYVREFSATDQIVKVGETNVDGLIAFDEINAITEDNIWSPDGKYYFLKSTNRTGPIKNYLVLNHWENNPSIYSTPLNLIKPVRQRIKTIVVDENDARRIENLAYEIAASEIT